MSVRIHNARRGGQPLGRMVWLFALLLFATLSMTAQGASYQDPIRHSAEQEGSRQGHNASSRQKSSGGQLKDSADTAASQSANPKSQGFEFSYGETNPDINKLRKSGGTYTQAENDGTSGGGADGGFPFWLTPHPWYVEYRSPPPTVPWQIGSWDVISCGTGTGTQTRLVTCPSGNCTGAMPASTRQQARPSCSIPEGNWIVGAWTPDPVACGTGTATQTRSLTCTTANCSSATKPASTRQVAQPACAPVVDPQGWEELKGTVFELIITSSKSGWKGLNSQQLKDTFSGKLGTCHANCEGLASKVDIQFYAVTDFKGINWNNRWDHIEAGGWKNKTLKSAVTYRLNGKRWRQDPSVTVQVLEGCMSCKGYGAYLRYKLTMP
ncbi:hypothetical protein VRRI112168_00535 [Vreelandella rituensis]